MVGVGLAAAVVLGGATGAEAATFQVTKLADTEDGICDGDCSLREAIEAADSNGNPGTADRITFAAAVRGTLTVDTPLNHGSAEPVTIAGPGANALTIHKGEAFGGSVLILNTFSPLGQPLPQATVSGLTISGGSADAVNGGGISVDDYDLTVSRSVIEDNRAAHAGGGGILVDTGPTTFPQPRVLIEDSTITDNVVRVPNGSDAPTVGGGVRLSTAGSCTVRNSTIEGNEASRPSGEGGVAHGGGLAANRCDPLVVESSTIAGNDATASGATGSASGGGIGYSGPDAQLRSTIVADNIALGSLSESGPDLEGTFDAAYTLVQDPSDATLNETVPGSNITGEDPAHGLLADNGGPTPTMSLPDSSPAIDKGDSGGLSADQRGMPRPVDRPQVPNGPGGDGADIGAFELQAPPPEPPPPPPPPPNGGPPPPSTEPSNQFRFAKVRKNKRRGIAILRVRIPGPGALRLRKNRKVKRVAKTREAGGRVRLKVRPRRKARRKLSRKRLRRSGRRRARVRVRARVTYRPTGGEPRTKTRRLRLVRKRARRR